MPTFLLPTLLLLIFPADKAELRNLLPTCYKLQILKSLQATTTRIYSLIPT